MKIVFIGAKEFSARALRNLIDMQVQIVGVCTLQESGGDADYVNLATIADSARIPVRYTPDVNSIESVTWIAGLKPDIIFCFGWSRLLKKELLGLPQLGVLGFHPAPLPANRGRHPIVWTIVLGLEETASTFFFMDEGVDSGDILSQEFLKISETDDAGSLYEKISQLAVEQIKQFIPELEQGICKRRKQDTRKANNWRKRVKADGCIDWRMSAMSIHNLVRGLTHPYAGAHFKCDGREIKVWRSELEMKVSKNLEPGKVLEVFA